MFNLKAHLLAIVTLVSFFSHGQALTNEGTDFYVAFTEMYDHESALFEINISSRYAASGTIEIFGTPFVELFTVVPGIVTSVTIPSAYANIIISETVIERAIHVTSDLNIAVYASTFHNYRSEATVVLPVTTIGSHYLVTTMPTVLNGGSWWQSEFTVVAGDAACDITIIPSATTETGALAGVPIAVHLEPGELYMVQGAIGSASDMTGTEVYADNDEDKFAIYNGHIWQWGGDCGSMTADPLFEVAYPTTSWGRDYVMTLTEEQSENGYRIVALNDGTTFDIDGVPEGVILDAGDVYESTFTEEALLIEANGPIGMIQTMLTGTCVGNGDPSMVVLNSNEQMYLDTIVFYAVDYNDIEANYINIVTRTPDIGTIEVDDTPLIDWTELPADPAFSYKIFEIDTGSHKIETSGCGFLAYTYGVKYAESYFYAAGVRLNSISDTIEIQNLNAFDLCDNDTIQFTSITSGGIVVDFDWDFGDGFGSDDENPIHIYTENGEYDVSLIVTYLCSADTIYTTINVYNSPEIDETVTDITCFDFNDGSVSIIVTEGTPDFEYEWGHGPTVPDLDGLSPGTYYLIVTDENGCRDSIAVEITEPPAIPIFIDPAGPFFPPDGDQDLTAGPPGGTWTSDCGGCIDPVTGVFDPVASGPGVWEVCYTVTVDPCDTTLCIEILVDTNCAMVIISNEPTCFGFSDGSFTVNVSGGAGDITFELLDADGALVNVDNSNTANSLTEGWYYINVSDLVCEFEDSIYIGQPADMTIDIDITEPLCFGDLTGFVIVDTILNNTGPYDEISYFWNPLPVGNTNGLGENSMSDAGAGTYNLLINDANGCSQTIDFTISEPPKLEFAEFGFEPALCRLFGYQSGNGVVFASAFGGVPDYDYEWLNVYDLSTSDNSTWGGLNPGLYEITVTDDNGCTLVDYIDLDSINPIAKFSITSPQFLTEGVCEGTSVVEIHVENQSENFAQESDPLSDTTFHWNFDLQSEGWIITHDYFETYDRSYVDSGTYNICLVAVNKNGCVDTACKPMVVFDKPVLVAPNIFTPGGDDDINNTFFFPNTAIIEFNCVIVNRWGRKVFEFTDINQQWDGSDLNGDPCTNGVYFYTYTAKSTNGDEFAGQGNVQIVTSE
ncbi:MAG: PKD repeat protein [Crocinitomix sp.]|jgi:PKD repeat protein